MRYHQSVVPVLLLVSGFVTAADFDDTVTENILVTGSRTPIDAAHVPASVTVIDRDAIEARQAQFVLDLLRQTPGIAVSRSGGPGAFTQLRVRGAEGNQVMVLLDGIELNDPANGDEIDLGSFSTADIERIEIVRGPQSALWGSDALAGVINIITSKGDPGTRATIALEGGSFGSSQQRASVSVRRDAYRIRAAVNRTDTRGINVSRFGDEDDAFRGLTVDVGGGLEVRDNLSLSFVLRNDDSSTQTDSGAITGLPSDTPGEADNERTYAGARADFWLLDPRWQHDIALNWTSTDNKNVDPAVFQQSRGSADRYELTYQTAVDYELAAPLNARHRTTFAVDYENVEFSQRGPVSLFGDPNQDRSLDNVGFVGEHRIVFDHGVSLSGSLRHDDNSDFRNVTTWRVVGVGALPVLETVINLSYGTGQKAPTFIERFGFASGGLFGPVFIGNSALKPERSRGWEAGLRQAFLDDRLSLTATWFRERLRDEINGFVVDPLGVTATAVNVDGTSRREGWELTGAADLPFGFTASVNYTYLDANEIDRATGLRKDEVRRPRHSGNLVIDWSSASGRAHANAFVNYAGTASDVVFLPPFFQQQRVTIDNYVTAGASARFHVNRVLELYGRVENAFDEHYEEVFGFSAPGLAAYAGIRFNFDIDLSAGTASP